MRKRLPEYLKRNIIDTEQTKNVRRILKTKCLNTVCDGARCPNKNECYGNNTATFLIMGNICTRNCKYCNIPTAKPEPLDINEPKHIAEAVKELGLKYVVITSVTRDDLPDGGAEHFAQCIKEIRNQMGEDIQIEILTPDFLRKNGAWDTIIEAKPNVFNHNIETTKNIFPIARPLGNYDESLRLLKYVKTNSQIITKSGLMVGLGETLDDIKATLEDLISVGCDILTMGQYIQPSKSHLEVEKYYTLEEFEELKELAKMVGFKKYQIGPLVRSSYNAKAMTEY